MGGEQNRMLRTLSTRNGRSDLFLGGSTYLLKLSQGPQPRNLRGASQSNRRFFS